MEIVLGEDSRHFFGAEGGFQVRFNNIVADLHFYYFPPFLGAEDVDPIDNLHLTAGIKVELDAFRFSGRDPR